MLDRLNHPSITVSDVLKPQQKWYNYEDNVQLEILRINPVNSTFAGTYGIVHGTTIEKFEFRGAFDPMGITLGWSFSYWNRENNYHSFGAWSGYLEATMGSYKMSTTGLIAHQSDKSTSNGPGTFVLQEH